jgi:N-acetylglucosaminyl-diphospho-decaprenol L-rhamnosyltransferase
VAGTGRPQVTSTRPAVDVGIVSWNSRDLTIESIDRLLRATTDVDLRVLVRDNGSTDGTAEAMRARFPEAVVEVGDNIGFSRGVNCLLAQATAPWFLALNSDAWPEPGAVRAMVDLALEQPRVAAVAPRLLRPDGTVETSVHPLPSISLAARGALGLAAPDAHQSGWAVGAALLMRRAAVDELGGFDESLFMYGEDLDWCWRAQEAGWCIALAPEAVVRHVGNASGEKRFGTTREQVAIRNATAVVRRRLGRRTAVWQVLNALGAIRMAAVALRRGDKDRARFWWRQLPAHLGR